MHILRSVTNAILAMTLATGTAFGQTGAKGKDSKLVEEVRRMVATQYNVNPAKLDITKPLLALGDELNVIEIVLALEKRYGIRIPDDRIMNKAAARSVGIHSDLSTAKLAAIVQEVRASANAR